MQAANLAFVFPGQGSQSLGMLAELGSEYAVVKSTFDEASAGAGVDLWALSQRGPKKTSIAPRTRSRRLLAAGVAVWRVWHERGGATPALLAGHSLGEYAALVCAGVLGLHDAAALVAERGRLMQAAVPPGVGAMAAILGGDDAQIAQVCAEVARWRGGRAGQLQRARATGHRRQCRGRGPRDRAPGRVGRAQGGEAGGQRAVALRADARCRGRAGAQARRRSMVASEDSGNSEC